MKKLFLLLWMSANCYLAFGQDIPQVTNKIFIKNVSLNVQPGDTSFIGNILIEDGIISDIGSSIMAPYDAKVVKGDSLQAYAGFVATLSHIGLKEPKADQERPKVKRTGYPPNDVAGITPEKSIELLYDAKEGSINDFRKQGFTISHSVPYGRMLPGKGSVISLNGASFDQASISKDYSLYAQWNTANGVFPATLIGIMAKWRELYRNTELANEHLSSYNANPLNRKRPSQDAATSALFPIVKKEMSVFFTAEKHRDVYRTLRLQKDLGFNLVIAEARDIDRILDEVQGSGAQVLLSLDLPDEEKEKKEDSKEDSKEEKMETDKKLEALNQRKKESADRYISQAKILSEKGIPVAFSYLKTKPKDIHTNLRRLVKNGLPISEALSALTTQPAATLGISNIAGTLEKGKIGNLVITTGPLFDEKSKIKMVMVDGKLHTYDVKEKKKKTSDGEVVDVSGEWSYKIDVPGMTPSGTMTFTKNGDSYDLEVTSNQNPGESVSTAGIELEGANMIFNYTMAAGGMNITIDNDITFDGNSFEGTVSVADFGSFDITGKKADPE